MKNIRSRYSWSRIPTKRKLTLFGLITLAILLPFELSAFLAVSNVFYSEEPIEGYLEVTRPINESKGCLYVKYDAKKITPEYFYKAFIIQGKPVVLQGGAQSWPAIKLWKDDYLRSKIGKTPVIANFANKTDHFGRRGVQQSTYIPFEKFLDNLNTDDGLFWYLNLQKGYNPEQDKKKRGRTLDIASEFLEGDFQYPPFMTYEDVSEKHFWMGPDGIISRLHYDTSNNILTMVEGEKKFIMFPPTDTKYLYPNYGWQPSFSKVDIDNVDWNEYPLFAKATKHECTAKKGDMLFVPGRWWHQVYSSGKNTALNFWYKPQGYISKFITAFKIYFAEK